jgi:uncharacterized membrane protein
VSRAKPGWTDERVEQAVGNLLRTGVLLAAGVVLLGGILYLLRYGPVRYGDSPADLRTFHGEPDDLRKPGEIVRAALSLRGRGLIQLGLLLLIATPVARVVFSVFAFIRQRDWMYVAFTLIVLAVLLYSLFSGHVEGGR